MPTPFIPKGPPRYRHQQAGLRKLIQTRGVAALLFEPGLGKDLALDTKVATPYGYRRYGDLKVGDHVSGRNGAPTEVLGIYPHGDREAYRVRFSDGAEVVCDGGHLWTVATHYLWNAGKWKTVELNELISKGITTGAPDRLHRREEANVKYFIPWCEPLQFKERPVLLHPYAMGAMLANAKSRTKFIPEDYLRGSVEQRKELLAGLLDRDGSVRPGRRAWYHTRSEKLAEGVVELVRSLGGLARSRSRVRTDGDPGGETTDYDVQLWTPFNPFTLPRKAEAYSPKPWRRGIVAVEKVDPVPMQCIKVAAEDGLFVVEGGVVTHNTATVLDYLSLLALKSPAGEVRALVVAPKVAVDTWVVEAGKYLHGDVSYWVEAVGGTIKERAEALASRGGNPYRNAARSLRERASGPRTLHHSQAVALAVSGAHSAAEGPNVLPTPRLLIEVVSLDTFSSRQSIGGSKTMADLVLDAVRRYRPDVLVIDESHKIKGHGSQRSRLLDRIARYVPRRILLTGTVMPLGPLDVFGQWRVLDPYAFGALQADGTRKRATFEGFRGRFARMGGYMGREVKGYRNLDEMQQIMAQRAVVARKKDALDLPPDLDVKVPVLLSPAETEAYAKTKEALAARLADGTLITAPNRLAQLTRLRQITSGFVREDSGTIHDLGTSKVDTAVSLIHDTLEGQRRIVVFGLFLREIALLAAKLRRDGSEVLVITGETSDADRQAIRERFASADPARLILVAQIKTMSLAVNELVTAQYAIFTSLSQQRDDIVQARDRLNRIGQTGATTFYFLLAPGTVDVATYRAYRERSSIEAAVLRHIAGEDAEDEF